MGCGPTAVRAEIAELMGAFPLNLLLNDKVTNENGTHLTQFKAATDEQEASIAIRSSKKEEGDCVLKVVMKELKIGGKNLKTMSNNDAIRAFRSNAKKWGLQAVQPDGYIRGQRKPAGWQYKAHYYEARKGFVLTQSIDKFDTRLPTEEEHSMPAAKRTRFAQNK